MYNEIFCLALVIFFTIIYYAAFKKLPGEKWQFLAVIPREKNKTSWSGVNFTYYGFFTATAYSISLITVLILLGSIGSPLPVILCINCILLVIAMPFAKIIARLVENKKNTITIGGASFIGLLLLPWILQTANYLLSDTFNYSIPVIPFIAVVTIAFAVGEGFGRLACLSFGCCYGKPFSKNTTGGFFRRFAFRFHGKTKKISYASNLENVPVVPVQAYTTVLYTLLAITGIYLFLSQLYFTAIVLTLFGTQLWRFFSEFLRADHRGKHGISIYQIMSLSLIPYYGIVLFMLNQRVTMRTVPDLMTGLKFLWDPAIIIMIELLWGLVFLYTGKSVVTASQISFYVKKDSI